MTVYLPVLHVKYCRFTVVDLHAPVITSCGTGHGSLSLSLSLSLRPDGLACMWRIMHGMDFPFFGRRTYMYEMTC